ncbi:type II secretion system protein [Halopseudomonas sabulinigri]|uniref:type II secretion system protein n=1 Tax=Halopseudomonas sabulinigri TaxID=472181 RepID=UPI003341A07C
MRQSEGFSFVELMVVLSILGIVAALLFPLLAASEVRHKEAALKQALSDIRGAIDAYHSEAHSGLISARTQSGYPRTLDDLLVQRSQQGLPFLRAIPADPFYTGGGAVKPEATWRQRSSQSSPENPRPGEDIYDVYSSSSAIGSNGRPYSQW